MEHRSLAVSSINESIAGISNLNLFSCSKVSAVWIWIFGVEILASGRSALLIKLSARIEPQLGHSSLNK
jgi:hypothetical protein